MIHINQIKNFPVTVQGVEVTQKVWGKKITALKGNTNQINLNVEDRDQLNIPVGLINLHKEVFLICDIFFVNKIPLFMTLSRKIHFIEVNHLSNFIVPEIFKYFKDLYQYHLHHGFRITTCRADGKFGTFNILIVSLPGGPLVNLDVVNGHVPDIESQIRVVKERCRATCHGLPFQKMQNLLTNHIFLNTVNILNLFLMKGGI